MLMMKFVSRYRTVMLLSLLFLVIAFTTSSTQAMKPASSSRLDVANPGSSALSAPHIASEDLIDDHNITIMSPADIAAKRQALIQFIWGSAGFPSGKLPSSVLTNVVSPVSNLINLERVDSLKIEMEGQLEGLAHHFIPTHKNNRLVVVHSGHRCTFNDGPGSGMTNEGMQRTISSLLLEGFSVLAVYMPHLRPGDCTGNHDGMFSIVTIGSPMKFFLESVAVSLNYLKLHYQYQDYSMVGLSGGGWTTTVYAAIDPRIKFSFPVAGTVPLYLRDEYYSHDKEQYLPSFYEIAGYPDLYILGSSGTGRKQIQILNRHDDCCFGENEHNATQVRMSFETAVRGYESKVKAVLSGLQSGFFGVYIDETSPIHMISADAVRNVIIPVLNGADNLATTMRSQAGEFCLDVPDYGRPPQNGDPIQLYQCTGGANQHFSVRSDGTIHGQAGLCLDVPDYGRPPQNGDPLQLYQCHGGLNQQFSLPSNRTIRSQLGEFCLDVPDYGRPPQNGDRIQLYQCHGGPNQQFSILNDGTIHSQGAEHRQLFCLNVPDYGRPPQNGDPLQLYQCTEGPNQHFSLRIDGTIRSEAGLCLDVPDYGRPPQNGDPLQLYQCHGGPNQRFSLLSNRTIRSQLGDFCLDVPNYGRPPQNGDRIQLYQCHGGPNQQFSAPGDGTLRNQGEEFCLDVPEYGRPQQNGDPLQLYQCTGDASQRFSIRNDGTIRSQAGLCLDVPDHGRPPQNGDLIQLYQCHGGLNQRFSLLSNRTIRSQLGDFCLDVPDYGRPPQNGDRIQLYQCHGESNQRWSVNRISGIYRVFLPIIRS